jgi:hypothetical protein
MRFWEDENGLTEESRHLGSFWDKAEAVGELDRLRESTDDSSTTYEVIEVDASGVYPADETPPWVHDPDRLHRRGYEQTQ